MRYVKYDWKIQTLPPFISCVVKLALWLWGKPCSKPNEQMVLILGLSNMWSKSSQTQPFPSYPVGHFFIDRFFRLVQLCGQDNSLVLAEKEWALIHHGILWVICAKFPVVSLLFFCYFKFLSKNNKF